MVDGSSAALLQPSCAEMASSNTNKSRTTTANSSISTDLSFEDEFEIQKAKIDIFNDVISVRDQLSQCHKDIEEAQKKIADNPSKIQMVELDFMIASNEFKEMQTSHNGHLEIWTSKKLRTSDVVFGSLEVGDATLEKIQDMISNAKLNVVMLEELLELRELPLFKEHKKAELDTLKNAFHEAKKKLPGLVAKSVELEQDCKVAERYWQERWAEEKKRQVVPGNDNLVRHLEDKNQSQDKKIRKLEQELRLLRSTEEWTSRVSSKNMFDDGGPGPDIGNALILRAPEKLSSEHSSGKVSKLSRADMRDILEIRGLKRNASERGSTTDEDASDTFGTRGVERPALDRGSGTTSRVSRSEVRQSTTTTIGSQQREKDQEMENSILRQITLPAAAQAFQHGGALSDAEWIMNGLRGDSREKKTKWYIENYGRSPNYVWKVLRGSSQRFLNILDWHGTLKQLLSLGVFESSAFKKEFEEFFKELQFWTLGWQKDEWSSPQAMFDWVENTGRGNNLYISLEAEFNNGNMVQRSDGGSSRSLLENH